MWYRWGSGRIAASIRAGGGGAGCASCVGATGVHSRQGVQSLKGEPVPRRRAEGRRGALVMVCEHPEKICSWSRSVWTLGIAGRGDNMLRIVWGPQGSIVDRVFSPRRDDLSRGEVREGFGVVYVLAA